jgi:hypothetical protein
VIIGAAGALTTITTMSLRRNFVIALHFATLDAYYLESRNGKASVFVFFANGNRLRG